MTRPRYCSFFFLIAALVSNPVWNFSAKAVEASGEQRGQLGEFREKVHPILEKRCFKCHGGGPKLKGNFRLTCRAGLIRGGDYGAGYDTGNPAESLLLQMLAYSDEDHQMPPKAKLPPGEIAVLRRWIESGAVYDPDLEIEGPPNEGKGSFRISKEERSWWAYQPVRRLTPPEVSNPEWGKNPIDAFIFARLAAKGLRPNGPAAPGVLIRRMSYDLTGLPPTLEEVAEFEKAYAKNPEAARQALIDKLLSRPQYGEQWARHWLDIVRYAETNGFERDNPKPEIWRYRDYVVAAFNQDKPYDQFIIEQLAGDEIERPTRESLTATGFYRLMQWDDEPADRKQHSYDVLADNVQVTAEGFLGTTLGCARCHNHKADPISQKDYYSFMAFFHGITPYATQGTIRKWASPSEVKSFEKGYQARLDAERKKLAALENHMLAVLEKTDPTGNPSSRRLLVKTFVDDARRNPATWSYVTECPAPGWKEVGERVKSWNKARGGFGSPGTPNACINTEWKTEQIWMRTNFGASELPETLVMEIYHDEDVEVYLNGVEIFRETGFKPDYQVVELGPKALAAFQTGRNVVAIHCRQKRGGQFIDFSLRTGVLEGGSLSERLKRGGARVKGVLKKEFGRDVVKERTDLKAEIAAISKETPGIPLNVVKESGTEPLPLTVQLRGSAHAPGDPVVPAFPAVFCGGNDPEPAVVHPVERLGVKSSGRRLALARWIADPGENPLSARVIMNRLWQHHFGRGIVPTPNDFGKLGELPTHPELLDWLAAELVRRGWSLKAMHRLILSSKTYAMSSAPDSARHAVDPQNQLFWRFNMRRLSAEELRDSLLALSGKLNLSVGGPWVFPPLPAEVLATASRPDQAWPVSKNEADFYRRSLYVHVKRSLRHHFLAEFDQAETDSPCAARFTTTVPTQALSMLNSKFVNDQAVLFARRLRSGDRLKDVREQIREGLSLVTQREPSDSEVADGVRFFGKMKREFGLDDRQAMERFALLALNLNEFIYLD